MIMNRYFTTAALIFAGTSFASAQFSPLKAKNEKLVVAGKSYLDIDVAVYPFARFQGFLGDHRDGYLLAASKGFKIGDKQELSVGTWYWTSSPFYVYQFHARYFPTENLGVQVALLGGRGTNAKDYTFLLVGRHSLNNPGPKGIEFGGELGLGSYYFASEDKEHRFTIYGQLAAFLNGGWSITSSYWYIKTAVGNITRYAIGATYRF